jgi:hypothetical protein
MEDYVKMDLTASGWGVVGIGSRSFGSENVESSGYFTRELVG